MPRCPHRSTLFPYTTLFRSRGAAQPGRDLPAPGARRLRRAERARRPAAGWARVRAGAAGMKFWAVVVLVSALATGGIWWVSARGVPPAPSFTAASAQGDPVTIDSIGDQVQTRTDGALPV